MPQNEKLMNITSTAAEYIERLLLEKERVITAIDGRCASGKTTVASILEKKLSCNIIHMDDFFLRPGQRTEKRLSEPGGNIDYERFEPEVLIPLKQGRKFCYRPYDCKSQTLKEPVKAAPQKITIIEGSYSCHPALIDYFDLRIFMTISAETQRNRILSRNAELAKRFFELWIPLEEAYFSAFRIEEKCEIVLRND